MKKYDINELFFTDKHEKCIISLFNSVELYDRISTKIENFFNTNYDLHKYFIENNTSLEEYDNAFVMNVKTYIGTNNRPIENSVDYKILDEYSESIYQDNYIYEMEFSNMSNNYRDLGDLQVFGSSGGYWGFKELPHDLLFIDANKIIKKYLINFDHYNKTIFGISEEDFYYSKRGKLKLNDYLIYYIALLIIDNEDFIQSLEMTSEYKKLIDNFSNDCNNLVEYYQNCNNLINDIKYNDFIYNNNPLDLSIDSIESICDDVNKYNISTNVNDNLIVVYHKTGSKILCIEYNEDFHTSKFYIDIIYKIQDLIINSEKGENLCF